MKRVILLAAGFYLLASSVQAGEVDGPTLMRATAEGARVCEEGVHKYEGRRTLASKIRKKSRSRRAN